jgi:23S rRNA (cytosine1962-C5)-methyltransferase
MRAAGKRLPPSSTLLGVFDVVLAPGRDRSVRRRHPWVLSGAIASVAGEPPPGACVRVLSAEAEVLGFGCYSPRATLRVRLHAFGKEDPGEGWLAARIRAAVAFRHEHPLLRGTDAVRLVNAEGDGLPGLVVDRYADVLVVRASAAGMLVRSGEIAEVLRETTGAAAGFERADATAARREGLAAPQRPLWGAAPEAPITIHESGRRHLVDVVSGQKTGFYLDQRDARALVAELAAGLRVLDAFAYTGGFALAACAGGATEVTLVESSEEALALAEATLAAAGAAGRTRLVRSNAFAFLREAAGAARYDLIVADPPPLARRRADVARASRAYKDLLLHALRRVEPGGLVLAFACSHHVPPELFRQIAFAASLDAARPAQVLRTLEAPVDHPVSLDHPEGRYLTGLLLRAV